MWLHVMQAPSSEVHCFFERLFTNIWHLGISIRISDDENDKGHFLRTTSEYLIEESHRARGMCQ